jgi:hypothetical protein
MSCILYIGDNCQAPGVFSARHDDETVIEMTAQNPKSVISAPLYLLNLVCRLRQGSAKWATIGA